MPDYIVAKANTGEGVEQLACDDIGGVLFPRTKLVIGADGVNDGDVSAANPLPVTNARQPALVGTWAYAAGVSGTVVVPAGGRVVGIAATSTVGGTITINAGATITVPANTGFSASPQAQLVAPTIVFSGTSSYFVEYVS